MTHAPRTNHKQQTIECDIIINCLVLRVCHRHPAHLRQHDTPATCLRWHTDRLGEDPIPLCRSLLVSYCFLLTLWCSLCEDNVITRCRGQYHGSTCYHYRPYEDCGRAKRASNLYITSLCMLPCHRLSVEGKKYIHSSLPWFANLPSLTHPNPPPP